MKKENKERNKIEEQARDMAKTVFKSENAGRTEPASICICGYTGLLKSSEEVKCCICGRVVFRDIRMKRYYKTDAKCYCANCALKEFGDLMSALEYDIVSKAERIHKAKENHGEMS